LTLLVKLFQLFLTNFKLFGITAFSLSLHQQP